MFHFQPKLLIGVMLGFILFWEWRKGYFKGVGAYRKAFSIKPYLWLLLFWPLGVAIFLPFDPVLLSAIQSIGKRLTEIVEFGSFIGRNVNFWAIVTGAYFLSFLAKRKVWPRVVFGAILGSALTGLLCHLLKFVLLRARPDTGLGPFSFFNWAGLLQDERMFQSFPSGDVALVSGAALYFFYATKNRYLRWLFFLLPLSTALARVSLNRHWFSDTIGSIGVSLIVGRLIWDYHHDENP